MTIENIFSGLKVVDLASFQRRAALGLKYDKGTARPTA
jgi:hypothetical protein